MAGVTDRDNGYQKILASLDKSGSFEMTIGIHEEEGGAPAGGAGLSLHRDDSGRWRVSDTGKFATKKQIAAHEEAQRAKASGGGGGGATVIDVATWLEFGTSRQEPRPAISAWADENGSKASQEIGDNMRRAMKAGVSMAQRADQLAQKYAGQIQQKIADGIPPPNRPGTVAKKGSSVPWIDTGQTRSSIRGKVQEK